MRGLERVSRRVMFTEVTGPGPSKRRAQKGQRSPRAELGGGLSLALAQAGKMEQRSKVGRDGSARTKGKKKLRKIKRTEKAKNAAMYPKKKTKTKIE